MWKLSFSFSVVLLFALDASAQSVTTGSIQGIVTDASANGPAIGVTVIARSSKLQGEQVSITDEKGFYIITGLPPGVYSITGVFAEMQAERRDITVEVGKTVGINLLISASTAKGEVIVITDTAPNVDVASATVGVNLSKEFIDHVPTGRGRDFSNGISFLGSGDSDATGPTIGGATGPENNFIIDGVNVTDMSGGRLFAHLTLDFVEEFDVKEGGYGPEFGRATGGIVSVVTKSGGNEFHGSVFGTYRPGFLQATARSIAATNNAITGRTELDYYLSTGFELGGPIVKDLLWFHVGYAPEILSENNPRTFGWLRGTTGGAPDVDELGNPIFDTSGVFPDAAGAPTQSAFQDNFPDFWHTHQFTAKVTHLINNSNRHSINVRGAPSFFRGPIAFNGDPTTFMFTRQWRGNVVSGIYNFAGQYFNNKLKLDVDLSVNHDEFHTAPATPEGAAAALITINTTENLRDVSATQFPVACQVQNDFDGTLARPSSRCPVTRYSKGGFGTFFDNYYTRFAQKVALTNLFSFAGLHQFKYGIDFEQVLGSQTFGATGADGFRGTFTYASSTNRFVGTLNTVDGVAVDKTSLVTGTFNYGAFVGDTWNPTPSLILNYGLRWEGQDFLGTKSSIENTTRQHAFSIPSNFAPRAGVIWDFTGNGKGAARFNYGRFYESIPVDLLERSFGHSASRVARFGDPTNANPALRNCWSDGYDANGVGQGTELITPAQKLTVTNPARQCRMGRVLLEQTSEPSAVAPGLRGQFSDEFILSVDYEPFASWVFGVSAIYRTLGSVVEDISTDGGNTYIITNPGSFDIRYLDDLKSQIQSTRDPAEKARLQNTFNLAQSINSFPKAVRDYWQFQFKLDKKLSSNFLVLATYVLSFSQGNYPGLFSATNGQLDPNLSSQFDLPQLLLNHTGYLPQDVRHRIKVSGFYRASLKELFSWNVPLSFTLGASAKAQSGTPFEFLGGDEAYGLDEAFLLPRGSGGRTPWNWSIDLNIGSTYNFTDNISLEVFAELFNIFNAQDPVTVDERYTADTVRPVVGGDASQLPNLRNAQGLPVNVNPNFGNARSYTSPFSGQFGVRLKF